MDEQQYKNTYDYINPQRCVFEKAINSRVCNCSKAQRFNLADREGVACTSKNGLEHCSKYLSKLREKAVFVIRRVKVSQALGHGQEIKIQNGGLIGLQSQLGSYTDKTVADIHTLIYKAEGKFEGLGNFPFSELMQVIAAYKIRDRRRKQTHPKKQK